MKDERPPVPNVTNTPPTAWPGRIHRLGLVGSTMVEARTLAEAGAPHGTAVVAEQQLAGRGRSGRLWVSPPGNLHMTVVLRPGGDARDTPQLGFVVAVAVADAVDRLAGPATALKWPNDIMRGAAKLAGILLERTEDGAVLAGIGVNVQHHPPGMPYPVTSLSALGCQTDPDTALAAVLQALDAQWALWQRAGFQPVLARWLARGPALGAVLAVRLGASTIHGRFAGLRDDGALLLDTPAGRRAIVAGDVQPCAASPEGVKTKPC